MFAMSVLSLLPVFLFFVAFQRMLVEGINTSGLKGDESEGHGDVRWGRAGRSCAVRGHRSRRGWLDIVRDASDLALLGILTTIGALGVVTAGGGGRHRQRRGARTGANAATGRPPRETVRRYVRALLPGVRVTAARGRDRRAARRSTWRPSSGGVVPGGAALVAAARCCSRPRWSATPALAVVEVGSRRRVAGRRAPGGRRRPAPAGRCSSRWPA